MSVDLRYSEVEGELRDNVRAMLAARCPWPTVLANPDPDPALWSLLATEMGLAGLAVPERLGGGGAGLRENAIVCEELGRTVAPVPYLASAVVATQTLLACTAQRWLTQLADGSRRAALVVPIDTPPGPSGVRPAATGSHPGIAGGVGVRADEHRLTGTVPGVADAATADLLLVPTRDELWIVEATAVGVSRSPVVSLDQTRPLVDLTFDAAPAYRIAAGRPAGAALHWGLTAGAVLLAAEQYGLAQWCLEAAVDQLKSRYQFGRPIGAFQALKHRLADAWVEVTQARAVSRYAVGVLADADPSAGPSTEAQVAAALAQAHCGPIAVRLAEECVQLYGGIGFTWEHPAHLYLKRARTAAVAFGAADRHRSALAGLVDLPPA
ncbi:acyl-CoA dehydrogenase family protein [Micromonospora polyrhachis]|uniref:Alkylation response protein AidB-like acyl-CoA dehydrogenase n=1 Tax=Micromonospora polyrhachis TaxID=1282883 RepID=A0A7W7SKZ8_9ACTN|nr:acyl-CoA dehydrogenase family protein [Micromonospora polyrhachis]MBB4956351.1 alkylation response protein AidB-like acyl-CoA dehydrogenase [Micromonospora polyrhachis]